MTLDLESKIPRDINLLTRRAGVWLVVTAAVACLLRPSEVQYPLIGVMCAYFYTLSFSLSGRFFGENPQAQANPFPLVVFSLIRIVFFGYVIGGVVAHSPTQIALVLSGFLGYLFSLMAEFVIFPLLHHR